MKKILIIDDDKFLGKAYQVKLKTQGHDVKIVGDGQEALDFLKLETPHLIILDLIMPIKDGFSFLEEFKANEKWKNIPIFVVTNLSGEKDQDFVKKLGVTEFINKTKISLDELEEKINVILKKLPDSP